MSVDALHAANTVTSESVSILQKLKEADIPIHDSIYLKQLCNVNNALWFFIRTSSKFSMYYIWEMEDDGKTLCDEIRREPSMMQYDLIFGRKFVFSSSVFSVLFRFSFIGVLILVFSAVYCFQRGKKRLIEEHLV